MLFLHTKTPIGKRQGRLDESFYTTGSSHALRSVAPIYSSPRNCKNTDISSISKASPTGARCWLWDRAIISRINSNCYSCNGRRAIGRDEPACHEAQGDQLCTSTRRATSLYSHYVSAY